MPAQIFQGWSPANTGQVEAGSLQLSVSTFNNVTSPYCLKITPYEKIDLEGSGLTIPLSQSRNYPRKSAYAINARGRESDFTLLQQLTYYCQQPCNALFQMADGKFYSFVKPGTTQAAQITGSQTGTNLVMPGFKFFCNDTERYIDYTIQTELSRAEKKFLLASRAAALTGTTLPLKTAGTFAAAANGIGSIVEPGFNQYAPVKATNTGGTAIMGEYSSGEVTIEAAGGTVKRNDNMMVYDRLKFGAKFVFLGVSDNDLNAFEDSQYETCAFDFNLLGSEIIRVTNMAQPVLSKMRSGTSAYDVEIDWQGHVMMNPNDASATNIVFTLTSGANILALNLADN